MQFVYCTLLADDSACGMPARIALSQGRCARLTAYEGRGLWEGRALLTHLKHREYIQLSETDRRGVIAELADYAKGVFDLCEAVPPSGLPRFRHKASGVMFRYVFGDTYWMGLSAAEYAAAQAICCPPPLSVSEMQPVHEVQVAPCFVAESPLTNQVASDLLVGYRYDAAPSYPAFLTREDAERVAQCMGGSLPTEAQWEYLCRAGSSSLFCFGDAIPPEPELARWLAWDLADPLCNRNAFGLSGLFFGEWCEDAYLDSYADTAKPVVNGFVIRGGGAYFWPWQDEEWVWCMSAMRMPSTDLIDGTAAARVVIDLGF